MTRENDDPHLQNSFWDDVWQDPRDSEREIWLHFWPYKNLPLEGLCSLTCAVSLQWSKHWHFSIIPKMLFIIVKVCRGGLYHFLFGLLLREYLDRVLFVFQILLLSLLLPQHRPDLPHRIAHMFKTEPWTLKQIIHAATSVFPKRRKTE